MSHSNVVQPETKLHTVMGCHSIITDFDWLKTYVFLGELKNPSRAIPLGTIAACSVVCFVYIILMFFIAATCTKDLLLNNYTFLQPISFWKRFKKFVIN